MWNEEECVPVSSILRYRWLEPMVATISFAIAINVWRLIESKNHKSAISDIFDLRRSTRLLRAGTGYWLGIWLLSKVLPRASVEYSCNWLKICIDLLFSVLAYDFIFYWFHLSMHRFPKFGAMISHSTHHGPGGKGIRAHHVLEHSIADGSLQVLTNILVQRVGIFGPRNWLARLLHNIVVTYLLTESHADHQADNDSLWMFPGGIIHSFPTVFKGAANHRLHHQHAGPPYQQFFGYLDSTFSPAAIPSHSEYSGKEKKLHKEHHQE
mmetsp:Transcript_20097/g.25995  ORF Transcript_20097/g.25995 Transcript_20097/m.25995 type:complete len:267 (-) Transcript_20097:1090-1890(-)